MAGQEKLPLDIAKAIEWLGEYSSVYGYLKWNEEARLKSSLMLEWPAWAQCDRSGLESAFRQAGFGDEDMSTIMSMIDRRFAGRRLVPDKSYRDFTFGLKLPEPDFGVSEPKHSREW